MSLAILDKPKIILTNALKSILRKQGYDVRRYFDGSNEETSTVLALKNFGISKVIDIGANQGQYGIMLRECGFSGEILSFEPLPTIHDILKENARKYPPWRVAPRAAIGERNGETQLHVASNSASSSILRLSDLHRKAAPNVEMVDQIQTPIFTLDTILEQIDFDPSGAFLKIDTQGYEKQVLEGATTTLAKVKGLQLEWSLDQVYIDQEDYLYFIEFARRNGFKLWNLTPELYDKSIGRLLQTNAFFFRA